MKVRSVALSLLLAACFMPTGAITLYCNTGCAACWKTGERGVDIKIPCNPGSNDCGNGCVNGYEDLHCAKRSRCYCQEPDCGILGPCVCGIETFADGRKSCKRALPGGCF